MDPIVFVHIPKTAGTSFRVGADSFFGRERVCRDYGPKSTETSAIVKRWVMEEQDKWKFKKAFEKQGYRFFSGHFHAASYAPLFGTFRMVSFVREPLQRLISEYNHMVRNYQYEKTFEEFYQTPHNVNRQYRILGQLPWAAIGFIGLTEEYDLSISLLNEKYNIEIPRRVDNTARRSLKELYEIPAGQKEDLYRLNAKDISLYDEICDQFDWRLKLFECKKKFVSGALMHEENGRLFGWAISENEEESAVLQAIAGGEVIGETTANQDRPWLRALGVGRAGFVGFSFDISKLKAGDKVDCVVANTGQPLVHSPWTVQGQV
ncbi:sulfotransferase family 2 domain-containing protein [Microbulbifer sp. ZKSA002]|uniref:sulfotransferase family 2 domain-containing protein n=1 Tax=Microbulbifer sp. ZKSA002 TaxID=3243388 RepID=UPI004039E38E